MIFLSAGIPEPNSSGKRYPPVDLLAVREVIKALTMTILPKTKLVWGGHPAITPIIRFILDRMEKSVEEHVTLYQSGYFQETFPIETKTFEKLIITAAGKDRKESLDIMRKQMITEHPFKAAIFIAGKDGVIAEYELFRQYHPHAYILPMVTTGGAASSIFEQLPETERPLLRKRTYVSLFQELSDKLI